MAQRRSHFHPHRWVWAFLLLGVFTLLGWGLSTLTVQAQPVPAPSSSITSSPVTTTDRVPDAFALGQTLYLERCGTCHLAIPPAVLPIQSWKVLLQDPQHFSATLPPLVNPELSIIFRYLDRYSRGLDADEQTPYRIDRSRYFKLLHPRVELPKPATMNTCISCHPKAPDFNFRALGPEWEDAP
jgi:hypothetical protein